MSCALFNSSIHRFKNGGTCLTVNKDFAVDFFFSGLAYYGF